MFYSSFVYVKQGHLAQVWLAAHWQRKLTKAHITSTNISLSAESILNPGTPLALRLSGQLLLGLVRIYSRKVKYLQEDCSDALTKMKVAFRPGQVDLPAGASVAQANAISLPDSSDANFIDFNIPDLPVDDLQEFVLASGDNSMNMSGLIDLGNVRPANMRRSLSVDRAGISLDETGLLGGNQNELSLSLAGLGRGDIEGDLNLDDIALEQLGVAIDGNNFSVDEVEVGRDGPNSAAGMMDNGIDVDFDFDVDVSHIHSGKEGDDSILQLPGDVSGLTSLNASILSNASFADELSASRVEDIEAIMSRKEKQKEQRARKAAEMSRKRKFEAMDARTEIPSAEIKKLLEDPSSLVGKTTYPPQSKRARLLWKMERNGERPILPTIMHAPFGIVALAPEVIKLFQQGVGRGPIAYLHRKAVLEKRRLASAPFAETFVDGAQDQSFMSMGGNDDVDFDVNQDNMFDGHAGTQGMDVMGQPEAGAAEDAGMGETKASASSANDSERWCSKRTEKMHSLLAKTMEDQKTNDVSFERLVAGKNRNIAAGVFYQLLVLKTHKYINIHQPSPYADIKISKDIFDQELPSVQVN